MHKKKILIIVPSLMFGGGAEKVASALSLNLYNHYDVSILTFFHYDEIYPYKGKYYTIGESHHFSRFFTRFIKMQRIIEMIDPDIIITFMNKTSFWVIPIKYLTKLNAPLIINVNTNPNFHYRKRFYGKFLIRFLYPLKKIDQIVPVSKELKKILVNKYRINADKIIPIYNGFDIERIQKLAKENVSNQDDIFNNQNLIKFITIGRLSKEKGHIYLIKAFSRVIREIPNSRLFIIGEGPLKGKLMKLVEKFQLEKKIFLLGSIKNPYKYISKAEIFVLSSLHEGLPTVLIEALACGLPIISTNCETGPKEILGNGRYGILTEVADSSGLAEKMKYLANNEEVREKFSRQATTQANLYKVEKFTQNWIEIIDDVINKTKLIS
ncbi:MAG: glycosyltransferase [Candidatus Thorarchaeota archaeon]